MKKNYYLIRVLRNYNNHNLDNTCYHDIKVCRYYNALLSCDYQYEDGEGNIIRRVNHKYHS